MNTKVFAGVFFFVSAGLAFWLYRTDQRATSERAAAARVAGTLSNEWVTAAQKLSEEQKVSARLNTDLSAKLEELGVYSNRWTYVATELNRTESEAKAAAAAARAEIEKRDQHITGLENEKDELGKKMNDLNGQIGSLSGQIRETERKLAASEGDRDYLKTELKRLLVEKSELERKFADLALLREQVKKLKEELSIANRIDFIRRGLYGTATKGATMLQNGIKNPAPTLVNRPTLEAELRAPTVPAVPPK